MVVLLVAMKVVMEKQMVVKLVCEKVDWSVKQRVNRNEEQQDSKLVDS
jgi:hypothetical protein